MPELEIHRVAVVPGLQGQDVQVETTVGEFTFGTGLRDQGEDIMVAVEGPRGRNQPVRVEERLIVPGLEDKTRAALAIYALGRWWTTVGPGAQTEGDRD